MYIRKTKSRNSICFQIGEKLSGRFVVRKHVGCASTPETIEVLRLIAKQVLYEWLHDNQLSLFGSGIQPPVAKLTRWKITGFHHVFGTVYDRIGFPNNLLRDLVVARIVYPKSKLATIRYLSRYLGITIEKNRLFRFLDTLDKNKLTRIAFNFVASRHPKGISVCFYDVTTLYFETTNEDDIRKKGFSKDHRTDVPQILIGLFVDSDGYPFDFDFYEGKTFEGHTFVQAIKTIRQKYSFPELTIVADAGMLSQDNLEYLDSIQVSYIVGARLKNLPQKVIGEILNHKYREQPFFQTTIGSQRLIVDYSPDRAKLDSKNRDRTVTRLKQKLATGKEVIRKSKYLLTYDRNEIKGIDEEKIKFDQEFDGLKGYFINQNNALPLTEIISQYHQLWRVEKAFRISKHDLRERPIFHRHKNRIEAHLVLCFISLLVLKETERYLAKINCSPEQAIELLGKAGEGKVRIGNIELKTESELETTTQLIHNLFKGH